MKLPHERHVFSIEYHEFSEDNLLNQVFKLAVHLSRQISEWRFSREILSYLSLIFDRVSLRYITQTDLDKVFFTRLNERFKTCFQLARIILYGLSGFLGHEIYGFFIDMNELFEAYVYKILMRTLSDYIVKYQYSLGKIITKSFLDKREIRVLPDYVIMKKKDRPLIILDAKYKNIKKEDISMDDIYQMYAYSKLLQKKSELESSIVVLIYPMTRFHNTWLREIDEREIRFFDNNKIIVIPYNLETILSDTIDKDFVNQVKDILHEYG